MVLCTKGLGQQDSLKALISHSTEQKKRTSAFNELIATIEWATPDSTIKYCELFLEEPGIEEDLFSMGNISYYLGRAYRSRGDYSKALEHFAQSQLLYESISDSSNIAKATYQLGILNLFRGSMSTSLQHLSRALDIYQQVGSPNDIADMYNALASYYSDNNQLDAAIEKYKEALVIYEEQNDTSGRANVHANLGMSYIEEKEYTLAEEHLLRQGKLDSLLGTNWGLGFHYDFMGYLYEEQERYTLALKWYDQALRTRKKEKSHYNICESNLSIASVLHKLNRYRAALPYLEEVISYQDSHQSLSQQERAYATLSKCYTALGQYENALSYHKLLKSTTDSIYQKEKLEELASMETAMKKSELDAEIQVLNKENEIAELSLLQQKKLVRASIFTSTIFLGLGLVLFLLYRKIKTQKTEIESALKEKDILLREIHHRVKNNLQIISSVLSLQSRQSKDSNIQQAINEGRNRVRSMALIHQNLYQRENLTGVNVTHYLEKLVEELFHTYNINRDVIQLDLAIEEIDLDVDTMIPLGLIINELVSNSLKHAFDENENGQITISLREEHDNLVLKVMDDGKGVTEEELFKSNSFGNRLLRAFSQKLKAKYSIETRDGTKITMTISNYLKAA